MRISDWSSDVCSSDLKNGPAPALAAWFVDLMKSAVNGFHNLKQRKAIEQSIARAAETGLLLELQTIYGDTTAVQRDQPGSAQAMQAPQYCRAQNQTLPHELQNRHPHTPELGEREAAVVYGVTGRLCTTGVVSINMS